MQIQCKNLTFTVSSISSNAKLTLPSSITLRAWKPPFPSFRSYVSEAKSLEVNMFIRQCASSNHELVVDGEYVNGLISPATEEVIELEGGDTNGSISPVSVGIEEVKKDDLANLSIWGQMKEIVMFTGPAAGLWLCGPLMSLIDTAVIGQGSSLELAALGPATVVCDYLCYTFMFLSVATSNLVATSLARRVCLSEISRRFFFLSYEFEYQESSLCMSSAHFQQLPNRKVIMQDRDEVQHQISILLFIGLASGVMMMVFTRLFGSWALTAFTGAKNAAIVPAANTYVQIRGLAWPALLIGWVAQSASLGMKDSWGPLKALAVASVINGVGDVVLCIFLGYGIAGAAWATMVSQVVAAYMMMEALNKKGYNAFSLCVPSPSELLTIFGLAAPVFLTMMSKVLFYSLLVYFATSMGTSVTAAHQVMLQTYNICTVWGEPLSQTAQAFMPELLFGISRNLHKARMLLKSLVIIGATLGILLGTIGTAVPWLFPGIFTHDKVVTSEMHKVIIPYFLALSITPSTLSLEGTLLAGRDLRYISLSTTGCFAVAGLLLMLLSNGGFGLRGCWYALVGFQWARFFVSLVRLVSRDGVLYSEDTSQYAVEKVKVA